MGWLDDVESAGQGAIDDVVHGAEDVGGELGHGYQQASGAFGSLNKALGGGGFGQLPPWLAPIFPLLYLSNSKFGQELGAILGGGALLKSVLGGKGPLLGSILQGLHPHRANRGARQQRGLPRGLQRSSNRESYGGGYGETY